MTGRVIVSAVVAGVATAISAVSFMPLLVGYEREHVPHRADKTSNNMWKRVGREPLPLASGLSAHPETDVTLENRGRL